MQNIEVLNVESNLFISFMISEEPEEIEVIMNKVSENITKIIEMSAVKSTCFFAIDVVRDDMTKSSIYIALEEQKCYVLYCDANDFELNAMIIDYVTQIFKQVEIVPEVYFESARHSFFSEASDIFVGVLALFYLNNKQNGLTIVEMLSLLCYNALPISTTLGQDEAQPGSANPEQVEGDANQEFDEEELQIDDDFEGDEFDDEFERDDGNNGAKPTNGNDDNQDDIEDDNWDDDNNDDFGGDDFDDIDDDLP